MMGEICTPIPEPGVALMPFPGQGRIWEPWLIAPPFLSRGCRHRPLAPMLSNSGVQPLASYELVA